MGYKGWEEYNSVQKDYKDPRKQLQGSKNRLRGLTFENMIDYSCLQYRLKKRAEIEKTPEPLEIEGSPTGHSFRTHFTKKAQPDFKGTLRGGRSVVFEAKTVQKNRIYHSAVTPAQQEQLDRHYELGALCFVLVSVGLTKFYRVPWRVWNDMKRIYGRKYMTQEELAEFQVEERNGAILFLEGAWQ